MIAEFIYNLFIFLLEISFRTASIFNRKAAKWVNGRKNWQSRLKDSVGTKFRPSEKVVWLHAASLGEFEQGKPLLEKIKQQYPDINVIVSFFSPSGFEVSANSQLADVVCYLPADTKSNAKDFLDIVKPDLVMWMKYEYWWNMLGSIAGRRISLLLISAIFRKDQPFFQFYGSWFRKKLDYFTRIFVQTHASYELIKPYLSFEKVSVSGDTRFDRVITIAGKWKGVPVIEQWLDGSKNVWVAGSTWHDDEKVLMHLIKMRKQDKWIIAPHKTDPNSLSDTFSRFPEALRFSKLKENEISSKMKENQILVIDGMGLLSRLYHYGTLCYIGGGFNDSGIHNTLEAAVYGKPVIFGPSHEKFAEAMGLLEKGAAITFDNALELEQTLLPILESGDKIIKMGVEAGEFVAANAGATAKIMDYIYENRLLTN